jgi:hypothetical protein
VLHPQDVAVHAVHGRLDAAQLTYVHRFIFPYTKL